METNTQNAGFPTDSPLCSATPPCSAWNVGTRLTRNIVVGGGGLLMSASFFYGTCIVEPIRAVLLYATLGFLYLLGAMGVISTRWRQTGSFSLVTFSLAVILVAYVSGYVAWTSPRAFSALEILRYFMLIPAALGGLVLVDRWVNKAFLHIAPPRLSWRQEAMGVWLHFIVIWNLCTVLLYAYQFAPTLYENTVSLGWSQTQGTMTDCRASPSAPSHFHIDYHYSVDGTEYSDTHLVEVTSEIQKYTESTEEESEATGVGRVMVHYRPSQPGQSVLQTGYSCSQSIGLLACLGYVGFAICVALLLFDGPASFQTADTLRRQFEPVENATMAGLFAFSAAARLGPIVVGSVMQQLTRTTAIVTSGIVVAIAYGAAKLLYSRAAGRLVNAIQSGVLAS